MKSQGAVSSRDDDRHTLECATSKQDVESSETSESIVMESEPMAEECELRLDLISESTNQEAIREVLAAIQSDAEDVCRSNGHDTTQVATLDNDEIAELRDQIEGKNELIAALVAELEQVAEQLDRAKRSGSDRPRAIAINSPLPAEIVEDHQQVLVDLQEVVRQLEELQAASALGRIESQLADLRDLVASGGNTRRYDDHSVGPVSETSGVEFSVSSIISRLANESKDLEDPPKAAETVTNWETMKSQLLSESVPTAVTDTQVEELVGLLDGLATPAPLDIDSASIDALKKACAERETYIVQVTRWVRTCRTVSLPVNWDELQGIPDELRRQVNALSSRLEEQVRLAEVEMSLERARLAREKSQLQSDRAVMDKHMKRLGITSLDELEDIAINSSSSSDRRWMRFLGVNRKS